MRDQGMSAVVFVAWSVCAIAATEACGGEGQRLPALEPHGLRLEVEAFDGPWRTQTNLPGYAGWGFRVSNARGVARSTLRTEIRVASAGTFAVWARGCVAAGRHREFAVEVNGTRFPPTHHGRDNDGTVKKDVFRWERCGLVSLDPGRIAVVVRDAGSGYECADAIFLSAVPDAVPTTDRAADAFPSAGRDALDAESSARSLEVWSRARRAAAVEIAPASWRDDRKKIATHVRHALGLQPPPRRGPLLPRSVATLRRDGYSLEKIVFESRPGLPVPVNLYLPDGAAVPPPPWPAVLCPVGHWPLSKAEPVVQARAVGLARSGFAALVYDALGQGERAVAGNEHQVAYLAALVGQSNMTYMVEDSVRALDYLASRDDIDASRLGVTGCSGGGLNTLYLVAVDDRIRAAAPVGYVCTFASFFGTGITHCPCSHVPALASRADMADVLGLLAPRPVLVVGGEKDPMFTATGTREAFVRIREIWRAAGADDSAAELFMDDYGHDYSRPMRERAYAFFLRTLGGRRDARDDTERDPTVGGDWRPESPQDLRCFADGRVPSSSSTYRSLVLEAIAAREGQPVEAIRRRIRGAVPDPDVPSWSIDAAPRPQETALQASIVTDADGLKHRVLTRDGDDASPTSSAQRVVLVLEDGGLLADTPALLEAIGSAAGGPMVRAIEPPMWTIDGRDAHLAMTNGLLIGRPPAALWARSLRGHIRRERQSGRRVGLLARGRAASTIALAAVLCERDSVDALVAVHAPTTWTDLVEPGTDRPIALLPYAGLAGDLGDLLRAAAPAAVWWSGVEDGAAIDGDLSPTIEVRSRPALPRAAGEWLGAKLEAAASTRP